MIIKRLFLPIILASSLVSGLSSCSFPINHNKGYLSTKVIFPEKSFSIKVIPAETDKINVKVTGSGLTDPIIFSLDRKDPHKILENVPIGAKFVSAEAVNQLNTVLAKGEKTVNVLEHKLNTVEIELELVVGSDSGKAPPSSQLGSGISPNGNKFPSGSQPPGGLPPGTIPPNTLPGTLPPGILPPNLMPPDGQLPDPGTILQIPPPPLGEFVDIGTSSDKGTIELEIDSEKPKKKTPAA